MRCANDHWLRPGARGGIRERPWARADVATLDSLLHSGIWRVVAGDGESLQDQDRNRAVDKGGDSRGSEIHNEILHDESAAFAIERKYPESNHAPVVATFDV